MPMLLLLIRLAIINRFCGLSFVENQLAALLMLPPLHYSRAVHIPVVHYFNVVLNRWKYLLVPALPMGKRSFCGGNCLLDK